MNKFTVFCPLCGVGIGAMKRSWTLCSNPWAAAYHILNTVIPRLRSRGLSLEKTHKCLQKSLGPRKNGKGIPLGLVFEAHANSDLTKATIRKWCDEANKIHGTNFNPQIVLKNFQNLFKLVVRADMHSDNT